MTEDLSDCEHCGRVEYLEKEVDRLKAALEKVKNLSRATLEGLDIKDLEPVHISAVLDQDVVAQEAKRRENIMKDIEFLINRLLLASVNNPSIIVFRKNPKQTRNYEGIYFLVNQALRRTAREAGFILEPIPVQHDMQFHLYRIVGELAGRVVSYKPIPDTIARNLIPPNGAWIDFTKVIW